jgi:type II secretion system protein H
MMTSGSYRRRPGFTLIELLVVLVLGTIAGSIVVPSISRSIAETRVQRAASVVSADLQLAHSMAARQRRPVVVAISSPSMTMTIRDFTTPTTIYSRRHFGGEEFPVQSFTATSNEVTVFPSGMASSGLTVTLGAGASQREIVMSRAGQVRVRKP